MAKAGSRMTQEKKEIIAIDGLSKSYTTEKGEHLLAVEEVSLTIPENSFTCIVGPSGCGKSTILRIAAGLEKATAGTVHYRSAPVTKPCGEIGLVFQEYSLFPGSPSWTMWLPAPNLPVWTKQPVTNVPWSTYPWWEWRSSRVPTPMSFRVG